MVTLRSIPPHAVSVRVILVQPRNPLNILAAARAARNFGLGDIAVVDVQPAAWDEARHKDVDRETPHGPRATSRGWLRDARKFDSLIEAIGDCDWVMGTSSLERRKVARGEVIELPALPARLAEACGLAWPMTGDAAALGAEAATNGATAIGPVFASEVSDAAPASGARDTAPVTVARRTAAVTVARRTAAVSVARRTARNALRGQGEVASDSPRTPNSDPRVPSAGRPSSPGLPQVPSAQSPVPRLPPLTTQHSPFTSPRRRVAILFGSEKRGLTNEHLMYCQHVLSIPTVEDLPSMNLGQAVAVVCYELSRSGVLEAMGAGERKPGLGVRGSGFAEFSAVEDELADSGDSVVAARSGVSAGAGASLGSDGSASSGISAGSAVSGSNESSGHSGGAESAGDSRNSERSKNSAGSGISGGAPDAVLSAASDFSYLSEKSRENWSAATAREKQALADYVAALLSGNSVSSKSMLLESVVDERCRNLYKMLNRMPLTSEDVRRILKLLKDVRAAKSEASVRPRMTRPPRNP